MKKQLAIILAIAAAVASAVGQQTNLFPIITTGTTTNTAYSSAYITIAGAGITNQPYTASNPMYLTIGDSLPTAFAKVNSNETWLATSIASNTNTVSVLNFSNTVLSSQFYTLLSSNSYVFTGSNYLGTFSQLQSFYLLGGAVIPGGTTPSYNSTENLYGSTNGGTSWFILTNTPVNIANAIMLSVVGDSNSAPGQIYLYGIDHPELVGRTNWFDAQFYQFPDPVNPKDAVNLESLNVALGNALNGQFTASTTNNVVHSTLYESGQSVIDIAAPNVTLPSRLSKSGTNLLLKIAQTNLVTGWTMTASTNIAYLYSWPVFTNYSLSTNSGIVTFTIPIPSSTTYFFWPKGPSQISVTFTPPVDFLGGTIYPSNTWSLYSVTNGLANGAFWTGNSNGSALVSVWMSNGVPVLKQLAP